MSGPTRDDRLADVPAPAGVRVWTLALEPRPSDAGRARPTPADAARLATLPEPARGRLLARRALLPAAVAEAAGCRADEVEPVPGDGPRRVRLPGGRTAFVSVSSSEGLGLLAVADQPVGVDLERLPAPPDALLVSEQLLAPGEHAWISARAAEVGPRFLATWVRKEAVVKCTGEGMSRDLRSFTVDAGRGTAPVLDARGRPLGLVTHGLDVPGHAAAAATGRERRP